MSIRKTTFVLISVLTLSLLIIGTKYWKTSEELALQKGVNSLVVGELEKLQYDHVDLQAKYNTYFVPSSPANDSVSSNERKICGINFPKKSGCDTEHAIGCTVSMNPLFNCSSAVLIYKSDKLKIGDVIMFKLPFSNSEFDRFGNSVNLSYYVHRIVGINGSRFIMKGDANRYTDNYQPTIQDVEGKVKEVIY